MPVMVGLAVSGGIPRNLGNIQFGEFWFLARSDPKHMVTDCGWPMTTAGSMAAVKVVLVAREEFPKAIIATKSE